MDTLGAYTWGTYKQHISKREIERMKKNMRKVPAIQTKKETYHNKEVNEAEKILKNISTEEIQTINTSITQEIYLPWYKKIFQHIRNYFIPSK